MKLFRHGAVGAERAGAIDAGGVKRDLSLLVPDITPDWLSPEKLAALAAIDLAKMPVVPAGARIGAPVGGVRQFVAIGLNYGKHAAETGAQPPKEPIVFNKAITSLQGPDDDVKLPEGSEQMDWEVELAVVIGKTARSVAKARRSHTSRAIASPTMFRNAIGRSIAAASGSKARASTRSDRSGPIWSRPMKSRTRRTCRLR